MTTPVLHKYQIISAPVVTPGSCGFCGYSGKERLYLDLVRDFEYYGRLYACEQCVLDIAGRMGYASPEQVQALAAENDSLKAELIVLTSRLAAAETYIATGLGFSGSTQPSNSAVGAESSVDDSVSEAGEQNSEGPVAKADAPADEQGRDDVFRLDTSFDL